MTRESERWQIRDVSGPTNKAYQIWAGERMVTIAFTKADADLICKLHNEWAGLQPELDALESQKVQLAQQLTAERERASVLQQLCLDMTVKLQAGRERAEKAEAEVGRVGRMYLECRLDLQAERVKAARYEAALRACRAKCVPMGEDFGHAGVVRIVDDALVTPTTEEGR